MPVPPLEGFALAAAIDLAEAAIDGHEVRFYRSTLPRGELDEAAIAGDRWLPGAGWADVTAEVLLSAGAGVDHTDGGPSISFTVADESRTAWRDDLAVAVVLRHYFPFTQSWGDYYVRAWGYLTGEGRQRLGQGLDQTGERVATYASYWARLRVPSIRAGRRNLASTATVVSSSPILALPGAEVAFGEYISQDDCAAAKLYDGTQDTASVLDVIADPERPAIGQRAYPFIHRAFGPHTRGVASGGVPRFVEIGYLDNVVRSWGGFDNPAAVPFLFDSGSNVRNDSQVISTIAAGRYIVRALAQPGSRTTNGVQWNIPTGRRGVAAKIVFTVKAGSTDSIGRAMLFSYKSKESGTYGDEKGVVLTASPTEYSYDLDSVGEAGEVMVRFQSGRGEVYSSDLWFEIMDLAIWLGYSDLAEDVANNHKLFFCTDNGAGVERNTRIAWNLSGDSEDWTIPPLGTVILTDDVATFKQLFGDTGKTVMQVKGENPAWFFGPNTGRMKLAYSNNPNLFDYDDGALQLAGPGAEVVFAGMYWLPSQALVRESPIGTGELAVEDYPQTGYFPVGGYGAGYWHLDLGAYDPPLLTGHMDEDSTRVPIDGVDRLTEHGFCYIGTEKIWWVGKEREALIVRERGVGGTTPQQHDPGDAVVPESFGGQYQNAGTPTTGQTADQIVIRRKPGTAMIEAGAVIVSNLSSPGNPSQGGAKWERHPDWRLVQRWADRQGDRDVLTINLAEHVGGPMEFRHICLVIDKMERYNGVPQRAKANEIVVREALLSAGPAGAFATPHAADLGGVIGYLLREYGGVPASKIEIAKRPFPDNRPIPTPPIGDLPIAPATLAQAVSTLAARGALRVWCDRLNTVVIDAKPTNPAFRATAPYFTVTERRALGEVAATWAPSRRVAQVVVTARDPARFRTFTGRYPQRPGLLGEVVEIGDAIASSQREADTIAEAAFREGNARRSGEPTLGALPWLEPGQRILLDLAALDAGGNMTGVNVAVRGYRLRLGIDDGGPTVETTVLLDGLSL